MARRVGGATGESTPTRPPPPPSPRPAPRHTLQDAKTLLVELATKALREAMQGARAGGGGTVALQSAIATAEGAEGVEAELIQEAKTLLATLLATQPLRTAIARREAAGLAAAIEAVDGQADVDPAVVVVSGRGGWDGETRGRRDGIS